MLAMGLVVGSNVASQLSPHNSKFAPLVRNRSVSRFKHNRLCVSSVDSTRLFCSGGWALPRVAGGTGSGWLRERTSTSCKRARSALPVYASTAQAPDPVLSLRNVRKLELRHSSKENDVTEVYVIGTAHVSETSCQQVREPPSLLVAYRV